MKTLFSLLVGILLSIPLFAANEPHWFSGSLELGTGDWLTGDLHYNPDLHVLEFGLDGTVQTFTSKKVTQFYFYDPALGRNRNFLALPYADHEHLDAKPTFFEVVVWGRVPLLAREQPQRSRLLRKLIGQGSNTYYVARTDGRIEAFRGRLKQLYRALNDHEAEMKFFVKRVRWYEHEEKPIAELFRYYNFLAANGETAPVEAGE